VRKKPARCTLKLRGMLMTRSSLSEVSLVQNILLIMSIPCVSGLARGLVKAYVARLHT
jgi:hypothetical protein